ncbi:helix-turn-helix domain-containing protein [Paenibacillus nasutitermitis]|uniref:HTH araC/xylS-type domain-containing protein n=1 Tax=Paenibacillus nasutitermitis TaxID=1652958 RepID=A0A916Z2D6_9BACL|nr:AraC family transcriptional regulator [Paenibacillus nasutitermitis]GGD72771.1 hypothetical protein GCM10010911_33300 [Paenibacillus nasutitermitis]
MQYISYNYHRSLRITDISTYIGLDRTYFSKLFSQIMGVSPQTYLLCFRIEKSLPLLKETDLSLSEICRIVGIGDPFYYSRAFKKKNGSSAKRIQEEARDLT